MQSTERDMTMENTPAGSCHRSLGRSLSTHSFCEFKWLLARSHGLPLLGTTKNYFPSRLSISFLEVKYMSAHRDAQT